MLVTCGAPVAVLAGLHVTVREFIQPFSAAVKYISLTFLIFLVTLLIIYLMFLFLAEISG